MWLSGVGLCHGVAAAGAAGRGGRVARAGAYRGPSATGLLSLLLRRVRSLRSVHAGSAAHGGGAQQCGNLRGCLLPGCGV